MNASALTASSERIVETSAIGVSTCSKTQRRLQRRGQPQLSPGKDRMISPQLQEAMAQRIGATVVKVDASHAAMLSKPA
jgi:hypothetical protein